MRKALSTTIALTALLVGAQALPAAAAESDTRPCVTKGEFRQIHKGMKRTRVHAILDTAGRRDAIASSGGYVSEVRSYRVCRPFNRYSAVSLSFGKVPGGAMRLEAKSAVWMHN